MHYFLLVLPFLLIAMPALSQDEEDKRLWLKGAASVRLNDRMKLDLDSEGRFSNDRDGLYEIELNSLITYEVGNGVAIGGGYVRSTNYFHGTTIQAEDRFRAHVGVSGMAGPVELSGRVRLEYRLRSDGDDAGLRLRPQFKAVLPISRNVNLVASHESFFPLNDTDWGQRAGYQRMRNFVGVAWKTSERLSFEVGYVNEHDFGRARTPDVIGHALSISAMLGI
jgi:hypothetical protein